jgi:uncharacterized protein (TIGR02118 family)
MAKLLVLYNKPEDPAAFDAYYHGTHVPHVRKVPGLRSLTVSKGAVNAPRGESPYHFVAELNFDSIEALQAGLASPESAATARDLRNFASAGVIMLIYDTMTEELGD